MKERSSRNALPSEASTPLVDSATPPRERPFSGLILALVAAIAAPVIGAFAPVWASYPVGGEGGDPIGWGFAIFVSVGMWSFIVLLAYYFYAQSKRANRAASRLGWKRADTGLWRSIDGMPFNAPGGTVVSSIISGTWGSRRAQSMALSPSKRQIPPIFASAEVMELPRPLPRMEIAPRSRHVLAGPSGGDDLEVESADFNESFRVSTWDREYAHAILHPRMLERLLRPDALGLSLTICGDRVVAWTSPPADLDGVEARLDLLSDVADLIPAIADDLWSTGGDRLVAPDGTAEPVVKHAKSTKDWLSWLSLGYGLTILLAPLGVVFGHWGLRAARRGEATNPRLARFALVLAYVASVAGFIPLMALILLDSR